MKKILFLIILAITFNDEALGASTQGKSDSNANDLELSDQNISLGLQIGVLGSKGLAGQYLLSQNTAFNASVGDVWGIWSVEIDWIYFFDQPMNSNKRLKFSDMKGRWLTYAGGGLQSGWFGGLRGVAGVQYGMVDNPFQLWLSLLAIPGAAENGIGFGLFSGVRYELQ